MRAGCRGRRDGLPGQSVQRVPQIKRSGDAGGTSVERRWGASYSPMDRGAFCGPAEILAWVDHAALQIHSTTWTDHQLHHRDSEVGDSFSAIIASSGVPVKHAPGWSRIPLRKRAEYRRMCAPWPSQTSRARDCICAGIEPLRFSFNSFSAMSNPPPSKGRAGGEQPSIFARPPWRIRADRVEIGGRQRVEEEIACDEGDAIGGKSFGELDNGGEVE